MTHTSKTTDSGYKKFRLHISGLTPSITSNDLLSRFKSFGNVSSIDGFGALDGNGDMRKFAFVTIEGSAEGIRKCCNSLSGTVWKGCKLRIGEARPDYKDRILNENQVTDVQADGSDAVQPPKKRRRLLRGCVGVHSSDMSIVTSQNYSSRSGWSRTPMGRLVRTMKMRPVRPLHGLVEGNKSAVLNGTEVYKRRKKKKVNSTVLRARRTVIDPLKYGSEYLTGILLESPSIGMSTSTTETQTTSIEKPKHTTTAPKNSSVLKGAPIFTSEKTSVPVSDQQETTSVQKKNSADIALPDADVSVAEEAKQNIALLSSLFSGRDESDDWGGQEDLSDIDVDLIQNENQGGGGEKMLTDAEDDIEVVPRTPEDRIAAKPVSNFAGAQEQLLSESQNDDDGLTVAQSSSQKTSTAKQNAKSSLATLKDVFKPRPEDAGFSLLGNLDIDLELDESLAMSFQTPNSLPSDASHVPLSIPEAPMTIPQSHQPAIVLDPSQPLFFPFSLLSSSDASSGSISAPKKNKRNTVKDIAEVFEERGYNPLEAGFCRTESEEEIRKRWESVKVELTRTYKKRHREAVKSLRRRGGKL